MKLKDWIYLVRQGIGDVESDFIASDDVLVSYLNDAICAIYERRKKHYAKPYTVRLKEGSVQTTGECKEDSECCTFISADAITDENGVKIAEFSEINEEVSDFGEPSCSTNNLSSKPKDRTYKMLGSSYVVEPPVLPGEVVYARVLMSCRPNIVGNDLNKDIELDCELGSPVYSFVMARVYSMPGMDRATSESFLNQFYTFLNIQSAAEKDVKKM